MRSKYGNRKTYVDGFKFDSIKEARYYIYLRDRLRKKEISDLRLQVPYELLPKLPDQQAVHYVADFVYNEDGGEVVVDVKSEATKRKDAYILKKKMMRALLGITIEEV